MPTANCHKNPKRRGGRGPQTPQKQKMKIPTNIGFKLIPKRVPMVGIMYQWSKGINVSKVKDVKHDYLTSF